MPLPKVVRQAARAAASTSSPSSEASRTVSAAEDTTSPARPAPEILATRAPAPTMKDLVRRIDQLVDRVDQLEAKVRFKSFACFVLRADAGNLETKRGIRIDHPLAGGHPEAILLAQPREINRLLPSFTYQDGHWYLRPAIYKVIDADWGSMVRAGVVGREEAYVWQKHGDIEDWQKSGGLLRVELTSPSVGDTYSVSVFVPVKSPPAGASTRPTRATEEPARANPKSARLVKPKTVAPGASQKSARRR